MDLFGVELATLDELDEPRACQRDEIGGGRRLGDRLLVGAGVDRPHGADDPDPTGLGRLDQCPHARFDHPDDRDVERLLQRVEGRGRGGVAGDDHGLHPTPGHQLMGDLVGERLDLDEIARAVGVAPGVAEVDELLVGQQVDECPGDGQAAEAGVEHADRPVVARRRRIGVVVASARHLRSRSPSRRWPWLRRGPASTHRWRGTSSRSRRR